MTYSMPLISPNFDVKSIIFPNFGQGPFPKIAGKSPVLDTHRPVSVCEIERWEEISHSVNTLFDSFLSLLLHLIVFSLSSLTI